MGKGGWGEWLLGLCEQEGSSSKDGGGVRLKGDR